MAWQINCSVDHADLETKKQVVELQAFIIGRLAFMLLFGYAEAAPENAEGVAPPASGYFATIPQFMQGVRS